MSSLSFLIVSHIFQTRNCRSSNKEPSISSENKSSKKSLSPLGKGSGEGRPNNRKPFSQYSPYFSQTPREKPPHLSPPSLFQCGQVGSWSSVLSMAEAGAIPYFPAAVVSVWSRDELCLYLHPQTQRPSEMIRWEANHHSASPTPLHFTSSQQGSVRSWASISQHQ